MKLISSFSFIILTSFFLSACTLPGNPASDVTPSNQPQTQEPSPTTASTAKSKLRDLISQGKSLKCTIDTKTEDVDSKATVYVNNGKSKIVSNLSIENGQTIESNMVVDGDNLYTWQTGQSQGIKIDVKNSASTGGNSQNNQNVEGKSVDLDAEYDYQCQPWNGQNETFAPPSTIKFTEMGETFKKIQENIQGMCDSLSGDAKQSCLDALENTSR